MLQKLVLNIVKNPSEQKFRSVKKTNKVIGQKLLSLKGIDSLITALGFVDEGESYVMHDDHFKALSHNVRTIDDNLFDIAKIFMRDEEREKEEVLRKEKKKNEENMRKEKAEKDELRKLSQKDRIEKSGEITRASKAALDPSKFGATFQKFEAPCNNGK